MTWVITGLFLALSLGALCLTGGFLLIARTRYRARQRGRRTESVLEPLRWALIMAGFSMGLAGLGLGFL
jgi:vacuolar-type H+-ATPase subunit I/STV1